jgi:gamma-glutamylcyclotransferase
MLYFAYADNMDIDNLGSRNVTFEKVTTGKVRNFRLAFHKPAADGTGMADLQDDRGNIVEGVIWDVPEGSLDNLDVYEEVDKGHYRRQPIVVQTSKGELDCVTYRAAKYRTGLKPSRDYLEKIIRGAEMHRLSDEYISFLRSHDTA